MPLSPPWTLTDEEWLDHIWIDMSRRRQQSLLAHLMRVLQHLLKWQSQPSRRQTGHSWASTIRTGRLEIQLLLQRHPSLRPQVETFLDRAYPKARRLASDETGLPLTTFPEACPWPAQEVLDVDFWPEA
jgi:hypothetical protein